MRKIILATLAAAAVLTAVPASAQIFMGAGRGGAGVQVGPFGIGVGPRYGYRNYDNDYDNSYAYGGNYAYGGGCQLVRERFVTPRGHVVYRTRRACY
jgi:hypothetical protein